MNEYLIEVGLDGSPTSEPVVRDIEVRVAGVYGSEVSASVGPDGVVIVAWVAAATLEAAQADVVKLVGAVRGHADVGEVRIRSMERVEQELARPTLPVLVGASEAAEILGVSRQRVHQLHHDVQSFPAPLVTVAMGPLWDESAIRAFAEARNRASGRPKTSGAVNARIVA